jgi:hypothetical protein
MSHGEPKPPQTARSRLRVGDAGRERAIGVLKRAVGKGQLTLDEFEVRAAIIYAASTRG